MTDELIKILNEISSEIKKEHTVPGRCMDVANAVIDKLEKRNKNGQLKSGKATVVFNQKNQTMRATDYHFWVEIDDSEKTFIVDFSIHNQEQWQIKWKEPMIVEKPKAYEQDGRTYYGLEHEGIIIIYEY
jgi:hypothetical protein